MSAERSTPTERNSAFRIDVRENTRAAAAAEFRFNHDCIVLISAEMVEELADWSEPVQLRAVRNNDGLVNIEVRSASGF